MNCAVRVKDRVLENPDKMALWTRKSGAIAFSELQTLIVRAQSVLRKRGVKSGDTVLLALTQSPVQFATLTALLGMGVTILLIEPWLAPAQIAHIVKLMKPKAFITGLLGRLWAMKASSIRSIGCVITERELTHSTCSPSDTFNLEDMPESFPALIAFTSGTTGPSKGVVRTQKYMWDMHEILQKLENIDSDQPDLCIFTNMALYQIGTGRGAVLIDSDWNDKSIRQALALKHEQKPNSLTCGPAFLELFLEQDLSEHAFRQINIGGALTSCALFECATRILPETQVMHVYGSSEAEPIAFIPAAESSKLSRESGFFHALHVGKPADIVQVKQDEKESLWISGPNVCPEYLDAPEENRSVKMRDEEGTLWHNTADRVHITADGLILAGRASQNEDDFQVEQKIYNITGNGYSFLARDKAGRIHLIGENIAAHIRPIRTTFKHIEFFHQIEVVRDRRHRARIDRSRTLAKLAGMKGL